MSLSTSVATFKVMSMLRQLTNLSRRTRSTFTASTDSSTRVADLPHQLAPQTCGPGS